MKEKEKRKISMFLSAKNWNNHDGFDWEMIEKVEIEMKTFLFLFFFFFSFINLFIQWPLTITMFVSM